MIKQLANTEADLIAALKKGDRNAFNLVYKNYYRMAAGFINNNNGSEDDIADIFQEMLFILVKKLRQKDFQLSAKLSTYIYSIIRNLWLQRLKKKGRGETSIEENMENHLVLDDEELEVKKQHEKKHELMAKVLETLKTECRDIIMASFYKKLSHQSIAEQMGYKPAFVRVKLHRCMEGFRKKVRQDPDFKAL